MLIVTRRIGESLVIGDNITVTVLAAQGQQIRIGVHAPKEIPVLREELVQRDRRKAEAAAAHSPPS